MDKFLELVQSLNKIIDNLEEKIKNKRVEKDEMIGNHEWDMERKKEIPFELEIVNDNIKYLKDLNKTKSIFLYMLKKTFFSTGSMLVKTFKKEISKNSLVFSGSIIIFLLMCIGVPFVGAFVGCFFALIFILTTIMASKDAEKFKKEHTIEEYEKEKLELESELILLLARINSYGKDIQDISKEIAALETERLSFIRDLKDVKQKRRDAVEKVATEEVLNREYQSLPFSNIIKRVREKEKSVEL